LAYGRGETVKQLTEAKLVARINSHGMEDRQIDELTDEVSEAIGICFEAVLESLKTRFPTVQFTFSV
jgi:hypothetical protein